MANPRLPSQKKCRDKAWWVAAEEAARNSSESGFKLAVWTLMVEAVGEATTEAVKKSLMQCKTCYHRVCVQNSISVWPLNISSSRLSTRWCRS